MAGGGRKDVDLERIQEGKGLQAEQLGPAALPWGSRAPRPTRADQGGGVMDIEYRVQFVDQVVRNIGVPKEARKKRGRMEMLNLYVSDSVSRLCFVVTICSVLAIICE